jgi:hypothetical protein
MSLQIQSGILAPKSRVFTNSRDVVEEEEKWEELQLKQADELLRAIKNNESQNAVKSRRLRRAEVSLFRGAPTGTILAACAAFAYTEPVHSSARPPAPPPWFPIPVRPPPELPPLELELLWELALPLCLLLLTITEPLESWETINSRLRVVCLPQVANQTNCSLDRFDAGPVPRSGWAHSLTVFAQKALPAPPLTPWHWDRRGCES